MNFAVLRNTVHGQFTKLTNDFVSTISQIKLKEQCEPISKTCIQDQNKPTHNLTLLEGDTYLTRTFLVTPS